MTTRPDLTEARDALLRLHERGDYTEEGWAPSDDGHECRACGGWCDAPAKVDNLIALARAEAGVSLEEMGKAWAAVEAALPEHRYFKVEHDSDDDPSWYLAVWRSDGIFPDPIRWAQADTLLDGLTRLALELRTPR